MGDQSALDAVPAKARKHVLSHIHADEQVHIALVGSSSQVLIALDDRLLIVKPGMMAGATFGAKVATFPYSNISAIEVNTTMMSGVIEVISSGYDGRKPTSYWSTDESRDPFKISNCLPIPKKAAAEWKPHLDWIRQRVAASKHPPPAPSSRTSGSVGPEGTQAGGDWVASLERLRQLNEAGALTDEEFQQAKERLLREQR